MPTTTVGLSMSWWVRYDGGTGFACPIGFVQDNNGAPYGGNHAFGVHHHVAKGFMTTTAIVTADWVSADYRIISDGLTTSGNWTHFVLSYDGSTKVAKLYRDGTIYATALALTSAQLADTGQGFSIAFTPGWGFGSLSGKFDEVGLWNRPMTSGEVTDLYNGGSGLTY
jgi:hypothetical protein